MHDSWARYYDFIYDQCFGDVFRHITDETLALIGRVQPPPARVLDLGAGTGRLAIPLARQGYAITAVDGSEGMADVLATRAGTAGLLRTDRSWLRQHTADSPEVRDRARPVPPGRTGAIDLHRASFASLDRVLEDAHSHDLAIAIFTVLNYVVDECDVRQLSQDVAAALVPGGRMIFDLAGRRLFAPALFENERIHREIEVEEVRPRVFLYTDSGCGTLDGERFEYEETFTMRYWRDDEVLPMLAGAGLRLTAEVTSPLRATGSRWFVVEKQARF